MDPKREPIDKDQETSAERTNESPEPLSDEASTASSDRSQDAAGQDPGSGPQDFELDATTEGDASVESFADAPDSAETGSPFFPFLAADSPSAFGEFDVPPDAFASDAPASETVDLGSIVDAASGQWFAGAGIPATLARSVEAPAAAEPVVSDLVARPGDPVRIQRGPSVPNLHQPTASIEQLSGAQSRWSSPLPLQPDTSGYQPLGMMCPLVFVDHDDRDGFIRAELDAFSERMTAIGEQTAEAAVRQAEWLRWTEERRLNPELR